MSKPTPHVLCRINPRRLPLGNTLLLALVTALFLQPVLQADDKDLARAAINFGISNVELLMSLGRDTSNVAPTSNTDEVAKTITSGYIRARNSGSAVALLDTSLEISLVGTDIYTGGAALVATVPIRLLKNAAMDALRKQVQDDARKLLAANVNKFSTATYGRLHGKDTSPAEIQAALNTLGILSEAKKQVGNDVQAQALVDAAITDALRATQKAELVQLARAQINVTAVNRSLAKFGRDLGDYVRDTDTAITNLQNEVANVNDSVARAEHDIDELRQNTSANTAQLDAINQVLFQRATPDEKLILIQGGAFSQLSAPDKQRLTEVIQAEADKQRFLSNVNTIVGDFNKIGSIVTNLLGSNAPPELSTALDVANTARDVVGNLLSGDILGAISGIAGLFGARPDPAVQRHEQLMKYLGAQFDALNTKLKALIDGQQKLMEGIAALSEQMVAFQRDIDRRLDRVDFTLDSIERIGRSTLNAPLQRCVTLQQRIGNVLSIEIRSTGLDLSQTAQVAKLTAASTDADIASCISTLQDVLGSIRSRATEEYEPLVLRFSDQLQLVPKNQKDAYYASTGIKEYYEQRHMPSWKFYRDDATLSLGLGAKILSASAPVATIKSLSNKHKFLEHFTTRKLCAFGTPLNDPWVSLVCRSDRDLDNKDAVPSVGLLNLPVNSLSGMEYDAAENIDQLMMRPVAHDSILRYAKWAETLAPLYDHLTQTGAVVADLSTAIANSTIVRPKGHFLLASALGTTTVALSQINMVYGDTIAQMVFDELWDSNAKTFKSSNFSARQKVAFGLLDGNPYLQRNVLMFALNDGLTVPGTGDLAYQYGLEYLESASVDAGAQLQNLFGGKLNFRRKWVPKAGTGTSACEKEIPSRDECTAIGVVTIRGYETERTRGNDPQDEKTPIDLDLPVPSREQFRDRALVFPPTLVELAKERDRLAAKLADYKAFDWVDSEGQGQELPVAAELLAELKRGELR